MLRRRFILASLSTLTGTLLAEKTSQLKTKPEDLFSISLAQWSNHRSLKAGKMTTMEWPKYAKDTHNIYGLEYVNQFFKDKAQNKEYLKELRQRVNDLGMKNILVMIDGEGPIGADSEQKRQKTLDQHKKWVEAAQFLGCHSIRVNAHSNGKDDETKTQNCIKGLSKLATFAKDYHINIIVENHGGLSSNGKWMSQVLTRVGLDNCGSLPDFGNFHNYDRYQGMEELMPFAKGVSAKSRHFDKNGEETNTDFKKMLQIMLKHKYHGFVGIEYEGKKLSEDQGIQATKKLLEKSRLIIHKSTI